MILKKTSEQILSDKMAISLSLLCAIHCLALPLMIILLPSLSALNLDNEVFHQWMVFAVIPVSAYALTTGCKQHKRYHLLILGIAGIALLMIAVLLGESLLGEFYEKALTLFGASMIALGHFFNYRLCHQQRDHCHCTETHLQ